MNFFKKPKSELSIARSELLVLYKEIKEKYGGIGIGYKSVGNSIKFDYYSNGYNGYEGLRYNYYYHIIENGYVNSDLTLEGIKEYISLLKPIVEKIKQENIQKKIRLNNPKAQ